MPTTIILFLIPVLFMVPIVRAEQKPYLISGFDDVLRQAENTGLIKATLKILENDKGFSGMPELYQATSHQENSPHFVLVSGISTWLDGRIDEFLLKSGFPSNRRYLRNWLTEWSIESFKLKKIKEVLKENPNRQFIVIFDNSDASINLAEEINRQFSKEVVAVYLRQVQNKKITSRATGFYTAFDIAAKEYEGGRFSREDVYKVGQTILNEKNVDSLIPAYAICPLNYNPCEVPLSDIKDICMKVTQHMQNLCER